MASNTQAVTKVEKTENPLNTLKALLEKYKAQIAVALPRHLTPERMIRVALTAVSQSKKLMECDPLTICGAIVQASIMGLEPSSILGEAFLIPYMNNKRTNPLTNRKGVYECQFQVGYKGIVKLCRNSEELSFVDAQLVYEHDDFDFEKGMTPFLKHRWDKSKPRGEVIGCWAGFKLKDGTFNFEYMTAAEIEAHRDRFCKSKDYESGAITGPWVDNPEWMWKKTPLIKVLKLAPKSVQLASAISLTEQSEAGIPQQFSIDVPIELNSPDAGTGSSTEPPKIESPKRKSEKTAPAKPAPVKEVDELPHPDDKVFTDAQYYYKGVLYNRKLDNSGWEPAPGVGK